MKKVTKILSLILAIGSIGIPSVYAASPSVVGSWNVTFFLEPSRSTGATQCLIFKSVPGTVAGVPTSGVWYSTTFASWSGQWIQVGDHVRWFGATIDLATSASGYLSVGTNFGGVSFNHFYAHTALTSTAGSFRANRTTKCPLLANALSNGDPADPK